MKPDHTFIYSTLADDEALGDLVEMFVREMPERIAKLSEELEKRDWNSLKRTVHQLKGSAGSHGFTELSPPAGHVETLIGRGASPGEISEAVATLVDLCRRVTSDAPSLS